MKTRTRVNLIVGALVLVCAAVALLLVGSLWSHYRGEPRTATCRSGAERTRTYVLPEEHNASETVLSEGARVARRKENRQSPAVCPICRYSDHTTVEEHEALVRRIELANRLDPSPTHEERIKRKQDAIRREHGYPHRWESCLIGYRRDEIFTPGFLAELEKDEKEARAKQREWVALLVDPNAQFPADLPWPRFPEGLRFAQYPLPSDCVQLLRAGWERVPDDATHFDRLSWIAYLVAKFERFEGGQFLVQELERQAGRTKALVLLAGLHFQQLEEFGFVDSTRRDIPVPVYEAMKSIIASAGRLLVFHADSEVREAAANALMSGWVGPLQEKIANLEQLIDRSKGSIVPGIEAEKQVYAGKVKALGEILLEARQYGKQASGLALSTGDLMKRLDAAAQIDINDPTQRLLLIQSLDNGSLGPLVYGTVFFELVSRFGIKKVWECLDLRECLYRYTIAMSEDKQPRDPFILRIIERIVDECDDPTAQVLLDRFPKAHEEESED